MFRKRRKKEMERRKPPIEPPVRPPQPQSQPQPQPQQRVPEQRPRPVEHRPPPIEPPLRLRSFLVVINDEESSDKILVKAEDVMVALMKFAQMYHDACVDWSTIGLYVEEVETIE